MKTKFTILFVLLVVAVLVSACGNAPVSGGITSAFTETEAKAVAENALNALNTGDYASWSRDWDDTLKNAINEDAFLSFREQVLAQAGQYQSITSVEMTPSKNAGSVRWVFTCQFEKAQIRFVMAFPQDGKLANTVLTEAVE